MRQFRETNNSHKLSFIKFHFAAASRPQPSCGSMFPAFQCLPDGRGLFLVHKHSVPFFNQGLTGNSTAKERYSHE
jgi:hypothetical protein